MVEPCGGSGRDEPCGGSGALLSAIVDFGITGVGGICRRSASPELETGCVALRPSSIRAGSVALVGIGVSSSTCDRRLFCDTGLLIDDVGTLEGIFEVFIPPVV